jgi:hypothetical protein
MDEAIRKAKRARDLYKGLAILVDDLPVTFRSKAPLFGIPIISVEALHNEVKHITNTLQDLGVEEEDNGPPTE